MADARPGMMMLICLALAGCGRCGFDGSASDADPGTDTMVSDARVNDAAPAANSPPWIMWNVRPSAATPGQLIVLDGDNVGDAETPIEALEVRFDFDSDGTFDTPFSTNKSAMTSFATPGLYHITAQVRDAGGLIATQTKQVVVADPADLLMVTTAVDEEDPGATAANPMGTGLSLREAILVANAQPGHQTIWLSDSFFIDLTGPLPTVTDSVDLVGFQEFGSLSGMRGEALTAGQTCLTIAASGSRFVFWKVLGCPSLTIDVIGNDTEIHNSLIENGGDGVRLDGTGHRITDTTFHAFLTGTGVQVLSGDASFERCLFQDSARGLVVTGGTGSSVRRTTFIQLERGIRIDDAAGDMTIRNNTLWNSDVAGIDMAAGTSGNQVHNNLFLLAGTGVIASAANLTLDYNAWSLTGTNCSACAIGGNAVTADPRLVDVSSRDFNLLPDSPLIDAGFDFGDDLNGPEPGLFFGAAPDIGAFESRY